jgi:uncharacterized protein (TIGR02594 family)
MLSNYGMKEVAGSDSNPEILAFFKELGYDYINDDSTTAWCSASLSYYAKKNGYEYHTGLDARGWLKMPVRVLKPSLGDVVIFWRESPSSWKGHIGLFIAQDLNIIYVLGGNQNNSLSIAAYPRDQVLGYRELKKTI